MTRDPDDNSRQQRLWTVDVASGLSAQLTYDLGNSLPVWSRDGRRLALSGRGDRFGSDVYQLAMDGSGAEELLLRLDGTQLAVPHAQFRLERRRSVVTVGPRKPPLQPPD